LNLKYVKLHAKVVTKNCGIEFKNNLVSIIPSVFLTYASDVLGDTDTGLTGLKYI